MHSITSLKDFLCFYRNSISHKFTQIVINIFPQFSLDGWKIWFSHLPPDGQIKFEINTIRKTQFFLSHSGVGFVIGNENRTYPVHYVKGVQTSDTCIKMWIIYYNVTHTMLKKVLQIEMVWEKESLQANLIHSAYINEMNVSIIWKRILSKFLLIIVKKLTFTVTMTHFKNNIILIMSIDRRQNVRMLSFFSLSRLDLLSRILFFLRLEAGKVCGS